MTSPEYLLEQQHFVEAALHALVPPETQDPQSLHKAMRYSLFAGGKRIRPILCLEAARAVRDGLEGVEFAASALELIHTYSLIHDDLPAMDNDDLRRGRPTCHKVFGEAMAILAGDALLTLAFQTLANLSSLPKPVRVDLIAELASASGSVEGMLAGQVRDIEGERQESTPGRLDAIHRAKTGALLTASVRMGAIYAGADAGQLAALTQYGRHIGLAFQIVDDLLDIEESSATLGKTPGKDAEQNKITFPAVYGVEESRRMAAEQLDSAHHALLGFGTRAARLHDLADLIVRRRA